LVDGGLVANIPVKIASKVGGDFVIAVNTTSGLHSKKELNLPWVVADQIVSIPMKLLNKNQLKDADFIIKPSLNNHQPENFSNQKSIIQDGYFSALKDVDLIKEKIDSIFIKNLNQKQFFIKNLLIDTNNSEIQRPYLLKYSMQDSVSNYEIYDDLRVLFSSGFYKHVSAEIVLYKNYSTIKFDLIKNPPIKEILINGVSKVNENKIMSIFSGLKNQPYNARILGKKLFRLLFFYRRKGDLLTEINNVHFNLKSGLLSINIKEGKISAISIVGNKYTNTSVIMRELPFKVSEFFNFNDVKQGLVNLSSTNLFDDIFITVREQNNKNKIFVNVREKPPSLLRFGFRDDNEYKAQLSLDLRDENLFGSGTELGMLLFGGVRNRTYILEQKSNRIFNTYLTYKLNAYYKFNDVYHYKNMPTSSSTYFNRTSDGEYRQYFYGASAAVGMQLKKFGNLILESKYQIDQIKNLKNDIVNPYKIKIISFNANSTIDTQNKYPYPTKGIYFKAEYETAQSIFGGEVGFTRFKFLYRNYFTFDKVNTFSPRLELGFADLTLPLSEQF
ncbi:MAG TPA: hypothetical protein ENI76_02305, partial [Ignavibacteria bacterium]|nr:hypothetical protein [Ignavibacteria bacterium]